ncbi:MAG: carboxymuconolactone decarboxylase family protein [Longimicrobiales bacterium]|nr:carboxymuconolactone decarboxylase family protein [Longimicrobiales bacterium]
MSDRVTDTDGGSDSASLPASRGVAVFERVLGRPPNTDKPMQGVRELSYSHLFPGVWDRPGLPLRERSLVTVALLAAQGREGQLRAHLEGAKSRGIPLEEILEVMVQVAHYAGWPAGMFGQVMAEAVYPEADEGEEE